VIKVVFNVILELLVVDELVLLDELIFLQSYDFYYLRQTIFF
jgi:hypothetical protein